MCRGKEFCSELGHDPNKWSKNCPLPLPDFFNSSLEKFSVSVRELTLRNTKAALDALFECNSEEVGSYFMEHGQQSAYFRVFDRAAIDKQNKKMKKINKDPRINAAIEKEIFIRDSYRCRYCGLRIISKDVFAQYARIVGQDVFSTSRINSKRNGLTLGLRGVADHVEPYSGGGKTDSNNLVTSCYSCNFGKAGYTLQQMGILDPRLREPIEDDWMGLTEFLPSLKMIELE